MPIDPGFVGLGFPQRDKDVANRQREERERAALAEIRARVEAKRAREAEALAEVRARVEAKRRAQEADQRLADFLNQVVGDASLPLASLVETEEMSLVVPDPQRVQAAKALAERLGSDEVEELFLAFPLVQEAWLNSNRDIEEFKKNYPELYDRLHPKQTFAETLAEEEARLRREQDIARKKYEFQVLFPPEKLTGQRRKAAILNAARITGADPAAIEDNFETIQAALAAADYDPVRLEQEAPEVASLLSNNPQLKPVGLFDNPLRFAARKLRLAVDTGFSFLGSVYKTLGAAVEGFDTLMSLGASKLSPFYPPDSRLFEPVSSFFMELGEAAHEARSVESLIAEERSRFQGNILAPSTWRMGDDPSLRGFLMQAGDVFGSLAPMLGIARVGGLVSNIGGVVAGGAFGALSEVGGAVQEAEQIIDLLNEQGVLYEESEVYRRIVDAGGTHEEAVAEAKRAASEAALAYVGPIALVGDAALSYLFRPMHLVAGKGLLRQGLTRITVGAAEEGAQETLVGVASRHSLNVGAGLSLDILEDSFPNFFWGAIGGGSVAAIGVGRGLRAQSQAYWALLDARLAEAFAEIRRGEAGDAALAQVIETARQSDTAHADPGAVAKLLAQAAAERGISIENFYLSLDAAREIFGEGLPAVIEQLTGNPDVDGQLMEAEATGALLEIPLERLMEFVQKNSEYDAGLARHLTVEDGLSKAEREALDEELTRLVELLEADERARAPEEADQESEGPQPREAAPEAPRIQVSDAERLFADTAYQRLVESGQATPHDASLRVRVTRALIRTLSERLALPADELFGAYARWIRESDQFYDTVPEDAPEASRFLSARWADLTPEQRLGEFFTDTNTGLLNARAFSLLPEDPARPYVAHISLRALKGVNDTFGHDVANAYFRRVAEVLRQYDPTAAKVGGDFVLRLESPATLDAILSELASIPELRGLEPTGALGSTLQEAAETHAQLKERLVGEGVLPPRGQLPRIDRRAFVSAMRSVPEAQPLPIPEALRAYYDSLTPQEQFEQAYIDPATGLLSGMGYHKLPPKKYRVVLDLNFLRLANNFGSNALGDVLLQEFGNQARELGAAEFDMAHISGDEYALQGDDAKALEKFLQDLKELVGSIEVEFRNPETGQDFVFTGVSFEYGIGRNDAEAEANLNKAKRKAERRGLRGEPAFRRRVTPVTVRGSGGTDASGVRGGVDRGQEVRGAQRFVPEATRRRIALNRMGAIAAALRPDGPVEDFFRATGRLFVELALEAAKQIPSSIEQQRALIDLRLDLRALAEWVGADDLSSLTDEHLDKLANGFLAWLFEGRSPSARLTRAFEWYRLLATDIYRQAELAELSPDIQLNDEIRGIFSKLVATEPEIRRLQVAMGDRRFFPTVQSMRKALGRPVTIDEWFDHIRQHEAAVTRASQKIFQHVLKDRLRENEAAYRELLTAYRREGEEAYEQLPERILKLQLRGEVWDPVAGKVQKVAPAPKLIYEDLVEVVGADNARRFNTVRRDRVGGADEIWNVADIDPELLKKAATLPSKQKWARDYAEAKMREEHPGILDNIEALRQRIAEELHFELDPATLLEQLVALGGKRSRGEASRQARLEAEARRIVAYRLVRRKNIGQITTRELNRLMREEQRLGDAAKKAIARGDGHLARDLVLRQMLVRYQWLETNRALKEKNQVLRTIQKFRREKNLRPLTKASPVLRDGVLAILEGLGFREPPPERVDQLPTMREVSDTIVKLHGMGSLVSAFDVATLGEILARGKKWEDLTFSEMHAVNLALSAIQKAAKLPATSIDGFTGERVNTDDAVQQLVSELEALPKLPVKPNIEPPWWTKEGLRRLATRGHASITSPETLLSMVSKDPKSAVYRYILLPMMNAKQQETVLAEGVRKRIVEALQKIPTESAKRWDDPIDPSIFENHTKKAQPPQTVGEVVMLAFYLGAEQNIEVLEQGRGIKYEEALTAIERYLDKPTMDWIQEVWDVFEELWPLSRKVHEEAGLTTYPLTPRALELPWGTYKGGYMMAIYDWDIAGDVSRKEPMSLDDLFDQSYIPPGTPYGHLKKRVKGFDGILKLDLSAIPRVLDQHIHDIAFRSTITSVYRLLTHPKVDAAIKERFGPEHLRHLKQWVRDVGIAPSAGNTIHAAHLGWVKKHLRRAPLVALLGYKPTTAAADIVNPFQAAVANGIPMQHVLRALHRVGADYKNTFEFFVETSPEAPVLLKQYDDTLRRQLQQMMEGWSGPRRVYEAFLSNAFIFIDKMQRIVLPTIWTAAYDFYLQQELEKGTADAEKVAILRADAVMRNTVPTFNLVDLPSLMRDTGFWGTMLQFYSYLNVVYQQRTRILEPFFKARGFKDSAEALLTLAPQLAAHSFLFSTLSEWIMGRGPWLPAGSEHEDEIAANFAIWLFWKNFVEYPLTPLPLGSDLLYAVGDFRYSRYKGLHHVPRFGAGAVGPVGMAVENIARLSQAGFSGKYDARKVYYMARAASQLAGFPIYPLQTVHSAAHLIDNRDRLDISEALNIMLYGERSETSTPVRPIARN